jgi:hypothetical protein
MLARIKRMIGRQQSRPWRHRATAIIFPIATVVSAVAIWPHPMALAGLAGGLAIGCALAVVGLRLTRYENTPQGFFYAPNAHIGIALSLLFFARLVYRLYQAYDATSLPAPAGPEDFGRSPVTLLIFGMLAGYYTTYAIGILRWRQMQAGPLARIDI